LLRVYQIKNGI